ncbi:MAG: T9SS type A sorting domain-containing protein [Bacteroidetes bacterium]|nr:T9SS type A sorting domain-containing protein [Bacteroidota bacterium]
MKWNILCIAFWLVSPLFLKAQDIKVYFNQSVNNTVSLYTDAQTSAHLDDTLCKYIDLAQTTLDIAVWDNGNDQVVNSINDAYNRGVRVRYITSSNASNSALSNMNASIPVLERNAGLTSNVMHNKFVIVDQTWLITGSMNFNDGAIFNDYNNIVLIHDPSMCINYTLEFEEMWGSTNASYDTGTSKFGPDKSDNTFHSITIGGVVTESYFSPTDQTTAQIIEEIDAADFTLDIALFTFINNDIGDAVIAAHNRGVEVRCIIENSSYIGSEYDNLVNAGIAALSHDGVAYDFHHKYAIIDAKHVDSNPTVITGSHNWTNSAEEEYDENTLIIHDPLIAWQYLEEFSQRWEDLGGVLETPAFSKQQNWTISLTGENEFQINSTTSDPFDLTLFSLDGKIVLDLANVTPGQIIAAPFPQGLYIAEIKTENDHSTLKLKLQ